MHCCTLQIFKSNNRLLLLLWVNNNVFSILLQSYNVLHVDTQQAQMLRLNIIPTQFDAEVDYAYRDQITVS